MFERYTESARRALFFARYETSEFGAQAIGTEHLLLGIARNAAGLVGRILADAGLSYAALLPEVERRTAKRERTATSTELPFSPETKRTLRFAEEEANRQSVSYIGTEHLLLGLLREGSGITAAILSSAGLTLDDVRQRVRELSSASAASPTDAPGPPVVDKTELAFLFQRIHSMVAALEPKLMNDPGAQALLNSIQVELHTLQQRMAGE
jgi:ATP-dependent Clp protease ATP-binding subunit ClpC